MIDAFFIDHTIVYYPATIPYGIVSYNLRTFCKFGQIRDQRWRLYFFIFKKKIEKNLYQLYVYFFVYYIRSYIASDYINYMHTSLSLINIACNII